MLPVWYTAYFPHMSKNDTMYHRGYMPKFGSEQYQTELLVQKWHLQTITVSM